MGGVIAADAACDVETALGVAVAAWWLGVAEGVAAALEPAEAGAAAFVSEGATALVAVEGAEGTGASVVLAFEQPRGRPAASESCRITLMATDRLLRIWFSLRTMRFEDAR